MSTQEGSFGAGMIESLRKKERPPPPPPLNPLVYISITFQVIKCNINRAIVSRENCEVVSRGSYKLENNYDCTYN